ncbi:MAG: hypothetical protein JWN21_1862 [Sphingomonas bacterium]|uniref:WGxxGxxG family protein n=1 Tax=Sphingomonas bacterium TaxID=1895847 RepID=UPI0026222495|nr:WGxxGxxG family protein [Sphingomonas bacterium]MDB5696319.1 hypothetical protein [Sphingomonas bacterium]
MKRTSIMLMALAVAVTGPAMAQESNTQVMPETQTRQTDDNGFPWDLLGLLGLAGLLGLRRQEKHVVGRPRV